MPNLTGKGLAAFAYSKVGTPYVYGAKGAEGPLTMDKVIRLTRSYPNIFTQKYLTKIATRGYVGKVCCDCSVLISWYTGKPMGSSQMYSSAYARLPIKYSKYFAVGTVLWKPGHVGVYMGGNLVCEERGIDYGCIVSNIKNIKWQYGLTWNYIEYDINHRISDISYKTDNPYPTPVNVLFRGCKGRGVKWLQWELVQAGFNLSIDGEFGPLTEFAVIEFQKSAKIEVDGEVGQGTIGALLMN